MFAWIKDQFGTTKPVIAMAHVPALPGTPRFDQEHGIKFLLDRVHYDVELLVNHGVDAIMFCNEDDRPYVFNAGIEQITAMTRVISDMAPKNIPFGVDFLWDPMAAIAIANATNASFIREVMTGFYESDMGQWSPNAGEVFRFRRNIGADHVRVFINIVPEFASSIGARTITQRARSVAVSTLPDVILVSGPMAGVGPDFDILKTVKEAVPDVPVFANTGVKEDTVQDILNIVDGVIVGSSLKVDGFTWNPVDPERVARFMEKVRQIR